MDTQSTLEHSGACSILEHIHSGVNPKIRDKNPKTDDNNPKIEDKKPKIEDKKPKIEDKKPKIEDKNPIFSSKLFPNMTKTANFSRRNLSIKNAKIWLFVHSN